MEKTEQLFVNSNPIRLAWREWALALVLALAVLCLLPVVYPAQGRALTRADYRLPGELASDYWMFRQWSAEARAKYPALLLGDSVAWGQYVRNDDTLAHHLNALAGGDEFANLGVDGLHPAALEGLVAYHGRALRGAPVLVLLNPLWMTADQQDLQKAGEESFNHPKLVPQVWHRPRAYRPKPAEAFGVVLERQVPFFGWKEHLTIAFNQGLGWPDWSVENPYQLLSHEAGPDSFAYTDPGSEPQSWRARGLTAQDYPWVKADASYQWQAFRHAVADLRSRGCSVFVLVSPFNTYMLTPGSRARFEPLRAAMMAWLEQEKVPHYAPRLLPTDLYADGSHPLGEGYEVEAKELFASPQFQEWRRSWAGRAS